MPQALAALLVIAEPLFTAWDVYELVRTLNDPCATDLDKNLAGGGLVAGLFLPGGGLGTAAKALVKSGRKASKTTKLYRAVSHAELDDIALHGFRPGPGSLESKLFVETPEDAAFFAKNILYPQDGKALTIVEAEIPSTLAEQLYHFTADSKTVVGVDFDLLGAFNSAATITPLNFSPVPYR